jgi:soluble lytic murein transglycosylase
MAFGVASMMGGGHGSIGTSAGAAILIHAPDGREIASGAGFPADLLPKPESSDETMGGLLLSDEDVGRYRLIYELQDRGALDRADEEIRKLKDRRLVGHVLAARYLRPGRKTPYADLSDWLDRYADHAEAERIHALAVARQPSGRSALRSPKGREAKLPGALEEIAGYRPDSLTDDGSGEDAPFSIAPRSRSSARVQPALSSEAQLEAALKAGKPSVAVPPDDEARAGAAPVNAEWNAGLAAWKQKRYEEATRHFETLAAARPDDAWLMSAAAFWAGRGKRRLGDEDAARRHFAAAALYPHTFYGLVASRSLGLPFRLNWDMPAPSRDDLTALEAQPAGKRAVALLQVGRRDTAERELMRVDPKGDHRIETALLALADRGGLPVLALNLGNAVLRQDGSPFDSALYPVPHWRPRDGFSIDRALIYAVVRQESRFDTRMVMNTGASGLMQILPATATHIGERNADLPETGRQVLTNPAINLELGQRYLAELLTTPDIDGNLVLGLAAYNAGPGNLQRWRRDLDRVRDPFLVMESLPYAETRQFVEKVLANYWLYRMHLGLDVASLDAMASGQWPQLRTATQTAELPR